jgi:hypothetical protein
VEAKSTPPPLCFVLMPFGRKADATGRTTDFDAVYQQIIAPAGGVFLSRPLSQVCTRSR